MYDTVRWLIEREREGIAKNVSRFAIVVPLTQCATCTKILAKNYQRLRCSSCSILHHNTAAKLNRQNLNANFNP